VRRRISVVGAALLILLTAVLGGTAGPAGASATVFSQVLTVTAANSTTTYATVEAWDKQPDGRFKRTALFPVARIGAMGMGVASESVSRTPAGLYHLSQAFGVQPNPGVHVPYFQVARNDVWTGSLGSVINEHHHCDPGTCPTSYGAFERLINYPQQYAYGAVIGYNMAPTYGSGAVRGKGSAFFLHVMNAYATGGCVALAQNDVIWILRWLQLAKNPLISLGVGSAAYAPIPNRYI
jgi:L,D-peptidoglycan transpeptidase YkuD (ErfK/YbiS/YcfS/YnhG family)